MNRNIYLITNYRANLLTIIENYAKLKVGFIQYRDKLVDDDTFVKNANQIAAIVKKYDVKFIINDRTHLLDRIECDGFHIGQSDGDQSALRKRYPNLHMGVSVNTEKLARKAIAAGANLIGVGAFFKSTTKDDCKVIKLSVLQAVNNVTKKIVIVGGLNSERVTKIPKQLYQYVGLSSHLLDSKDPKLTLKKLQQAIKF